MGNAPARPGPPLRVLARPTFAVLALAIMLAPLATNRLAFAKEALETEALAPGGSARVARVIDGDTVRLADGRDVRLVGIQAPKLPLGRPGFSAWPLADEARAALEALVAGETVTLGYGGARMDRHGRALAHLHTRAGTWVQGEMLARGLARVYTFGDNRALAADLYAREREARAAGRGIWREPYYRIRSPADVGRDIGTFQIVEGRVHGAAVVKGRTYINFGPDYREDFTIVIPPRSRRGFKALIPEPAALAGRRLQARGWIQSFNGPMIEATHPEQIEMLEP